MHKHPQSRDDMFAKRPARVALTVTEIVVTPNSEELTGKAYKSRYGRCEDAPCCGCCGGTEAYY